MDPLRFSETPKLHNASMVLAFSGWMDGGDVSTGTVEYLLDAGDAAEVASIASDDFYVMSFPASMEVSALVRPPTEVAEGRVRSLEMPENLIHCDAAHNLVLFEGKEPHLRWPSFADALFRCAERLNVRAVAFVGSVSGTIPHTRQPRIHASATNGRLVERLVRAGVGLTNYEGPASFVTYLLVEAERRGLDMYSLVAEIPAYVQGRYPIAVETMLRLLSRLLSLPIGLEDAALASSEFREQLDELICKRSDLRELVSKLEDEYDRETHESRMENLRAWFEKQDLPPS